VSFKSESQRRRVMAKLHGPRKPALAPKALGRALRVGTIVGAERWPYQNAHPDAWKQPWKGVVLAPNDPQAWAGSVAFPHGVPTQAEVDAELRQLKAVGLSDDRVPVAWEFGKVHWERPSSLRPYERDVREWEQARKRKRADYKPKAQGGGA
jgi:hypothetical protein